LIRKDHLLDSELMKSSKVVTKVKKNMFSIICYQVFIKVSMGDHDMAYLNTT